MHNSQYAVTMLYVSTLFDVGWTARSKIGGIIFMVQEFTLDCAAMDYNLYKKKHFSIKYFF